MNIILAEENAERSLKGTRKKGECIAVVLLAAAVAGTSLNGGTYSTVDRGATAAVIWGAFLTLILATRWPRRWPSRQTWVVAASICALTAFATLSLLWTDSAERTFNEVTKLLLYLGTFALFSLFTLQARNRNVLVDGLSAGLAVVVVLAGLSRLEPGLFPEQALQQLNPETAPRLSYPFNYWNGVGLLVAMTVPLLLHQASRVDRSVAWRAAAAALLPISGLVLYLTFSRGSIAATAVAAATFLLAGPVRAAAMRACVTGALGAGALIALVISYPELDDGLLDTAAAQAQGHRALAALAIMTLLVFVTGLAEPERRLTRANRPSTGARSMRIALVAIALAAAVAGAAAMVSQWDDFRTNSARVAQTDATARFANTSSNGRYQYWRSALDAFEERPLGGQGAGTWQFWWLSHATLDAPVRDSHSIVFDALAELGIPGLLCVLALLGSVLWVGVRRVRHDVDPGVAGALLGAAAAFTVSAAIDWTWEIPALGMVFFACAAILAVGADARPERRTDRRFAAGVAISGLAWVALFAQLMSLTSAYQLRRSRSEAGGGDLAAAQAAARSAASIQPWSASARRQLALVLQERGDLGDARDKAREAVAKESTNWENWYVLARIEAELGDRDVALEDLDRARRLNPESTLWRKLGFVEGGPVLAIAGPDFVPDDAGSAITGGERSNTEVFQGAESRIVQTGQSMEISELRGLVPGDDYEIRFAVKPLAGERAGGRVGDTSGGGWNVGFWNAEPGTWTEASVVLTARGSTERLAFLVDGGGPVAFDAVAVVHRGTGG